MALVLRDAPMKACCYEKTGPARDVLQFGDVETPVAKAGEARIKIYASGINPADVNCVPVFRHTAITSPL